MTLVNSIYHNLRGDKAIWFIVAVLGVFSILAVYSASGSMAYKYHDGNTTYYLVRQILFIAAGFGVMYVCYLLHYMQYARLAPLLLIIAVPLLLFTVGFGTEFNDARRWITIPWIDQTFQTSDFAKLALIIFIAKSLSAKQEFIKDFNSAFIPLIIPIVLVCGLIAIPDASTAILLFTTCMLMMFIGRVSLKYIALLIIIGIAVTSVIIILGKFFPDLGRVTTWISRIESYIDPSASADGIYQITQSKIAIANGGWFGVAPGMSIQKDFLPYAYADFIYAVICEEYGLVGAFGILALYVWLLFRCISIVTKCPKAFGAILALGLCLNLVIHALANMAVSVHLVPVTGLTLPLVSMGGTSVIFTCVSLGVILSVSKYVEEARLQQIALEQIEVRDANSI